MSDKSSSSDSDNLSTVAEDGDASDVDEKIPVAARAESRSRSPPLKVNSSPATKAPSIVTKQNVETVGKAPTEERVDNSFPVPLIAAFLGGVLVGVFFALYVVVPVQQVFSDLATAHDDAAVESCMTNQAAACDDGWTHFEETDKCYKVIRAAMDFHEAHFSCRMLGAHLASIQSEQENMMIANLSSHHHTDGIAYTWIGLFNPTRDDDGWMWTDGSAMTFQKDISYCKRNEACGAIVTDDPHSPSTVGHWVPAECSSTFFAVCSKIPHRSNNSVTGWL